MSDADIRREIIVKVLREAAATYTRFAHDARRGSSFEIINHEKAATLRDVARFLESNLIDIPISGISYTLAAAPGSPDA